MDVVGTLIIVPQYKELKFLVGSFAAAGYPTRSSTLGRLACHVLEDLGLLFAVGGHGKTQLAVQTQHLIEQMSGLQAVICAGAAGSLREQLMLGDIVVGTSTIEHDYKLRFVRRPLPWHQADPNLLREFHLVAGQVDANFRLHFGAIASGDEDIVDRTRALELRKETKALCVAWEGAGAARAAMFSGIPFLEIRAITDGADHAAAADFERNLERSMPNLAQILLKWSLVRRQGARP